MLLHSMPVAATLPAPPVVLLPACNRVLGDHPSHTIGRKYVEAVRLAGALPLVLPWLEPGEIDAALDLAHGVLLTGSPSNVDPARFGEAVHDPSLPLDPLRDSWTLPLARRALERGVPLLGICRGLQEVNVALGGSLHQAVHELPGVADHRSDDDDPVDVQYRPVHRVRVARGGVLQGIVGAEAAERGLDVNSLHGQGVHRLAPGLRVEATAPDGTVEAFTLPSSNGFNLCVQWHPEWLPAADPVSARILRAFGAAVRAHRDAAAPSRHRPSPCE